MAIHEQSCTVCLEKMQTQCDSDHSGMSKVNESCTAICKVCSVYRFEFVGNHSAVFMSKRSVFDKLGARCVSSMLRDAFGDLILVPNSKSTERLAERRAEGLAAAAAAVAAAFVC